MVEQRYQTFWPRFWAAMIDALVLLPTGYLASWVYSIGLPSTLNFGYFVFDSLLGFAYSVSMHGRFGQTLGKMALKVVVLDKSLGALPWRQAFLRDLVPILITVAFVIDASGLVLSGVNPDQIFEKGYRMSPLLWVGVFWMVAELLTMLTNNKRRALHDFIARSVVVKRSNSTVNPDAPPSGGAPVT